jgi:sodium/bile acid cotransporter 7
MNEKADMERSESGFHPAWLTSCQAFVLKHFLPIAFAIALTWALAWPMPGRAVALVTVRPLRKHTPGNTCSRHTSKAYVYCCHASLIRSITLRLSCQVLGDVHIVQEICIAVVFFISGLVLNTQELRRVRRERAALGG